jgi:tryptophan synthase alpha chain
MADGPVIQRAAERALKHDITLAQVLGMVREFRKNDPATPVILMGYLNPVEVMGYERFARDAAAAGVDGLLTVDMPPEESDELTRAMRAHGLDGIYLLAPTSSEARIQRIVESASGFIYYVSLRGVTGASHLDLAEVSGKLRSIRKHTALPVGVGFGIGTPEAAAAVAEFADAVIVGSAIVRRIEENASQPDKILKELPGFLAQLRQAMDRATVRPESASGASR